MFPEVSIPGLAHPLSTYGASRSIALMLAMWISAELAERDGLPKTKMYVVLVYSILVGIISGKALHLIVEWTQFRDQWDKLFSSNTWQMGGVYWGAILGGFIAPLVWRWGLPWRRGADSAAVSIPLAYAIGRLGCFGAGCCWGKPTASWIGVRFTQKAHEESGVPIDTDLVPIQLISSFVSLFVFAILAWLWKHRRFDGQVVFAYMMLYSFTRFILEFWRDDPRGQVLGLSTSQFISVLVFFLGLGLTVYYWNRLDGERRASAVKTHS